ncbi:MAG: hypothetical protein WA688_01475 [Thermoplasmata archaeon]
MKLGIILALTTVILICAGGTIGYAWQSGGGCNTSNGGDCSASGGLLWTGYSAPVASAAIVKCTISISSTTLLTIGASNLLPGASCKFSAALLNTGTAPSNLGDTISLGSSCSDFQYSDNIYGDHPDPIVGAGDTFAYASAISLSASAGNACEGARAAIEVTITGTESAPALVAPTISVSPTTINSGQSSTLSTVTSFSGGASPYTCQWLVEGPGESGYADLGSPFSCSPGVKPTVSTGALSTTGTWHFELQVADSEPARITSNLVSVTVEPRPITYSVTFSECGLPSGLTWKVTLNGLSMSLITNGGTDSLTWTGLSSGTYAYSVAGNAGWHQTTLPYSGNVGVSGASLTEPTLLYAPVTYTVTFTETGLPTGTSWSVTTNGMTKSSMTSQITFSELNGTYAYTVGSVSGCERSPASGTVTVNGAGVSVSVKVTKE